MQNKKKIIRNLVFVLIITIFVFIFIFAKNDFEAILKTLKKINLIKFLIAFFVIVIHLITMSMSFIRISKSSKLEISTLDNFLIASTEPFFNGITPFQSGGQPIQMFLFNRCNVKSSSSASVLLMNFIIFQCVVVLLTILSIIFCFNSLKETDNFIILVVIGFVINLLIILGTILVSVSKKFKGFFIGILNLIAKIIKPLAGKIEIIKVKSLNFIDEFQNSIKEMSKKKKDVAVSAFLKIISLLCLYSVPFFIFRSLGVDLKPSDLIVVIGMSVFAASVTIFIPTPGASGGAEFAFNVLFITLAGVTQPITLAATLLWRMLTYYLLMIFGLASYLIFMRRRKIDENRTIY